MDLSHLLRMARLIESLEIPFMITGSVASILYGRPRLTEDMDVVIVLPSRKIDAFAGLFDIREYYCPPVEILREEAARATNGHFNIIDQATGFKADMYPVGSDPLAQWGLARRRRIEMLPGEEAWVAPPEYVILKKLVYYREGGSEKHLQDIGGMLEVSGNEIDQEAIREWAQRLGLQDLWERTIDGPVKNA
jgi:hypothetical protein